MSTAYLKVKIKSLAEEARIIRHEERKARQSARWLLRHQQPSEDAYNLFFGLRHHRTWDVRNEQRASLLAYGYLRNKPFRAIEGRTPGQLKKKPETIQDGEALGKALIRAADLVAKYGPNPNKQDARKALDVWSDG